MQRSLWVLAVLTAAIPALAQTPAAKKSDKPSKQPAAKERDTSSIAFSISSVQSGAWSEPKTWRPARVPGKDDRVRLKLAGHADKTLSLRPDHDDELTVRLAQARPAPPPRPKATGHAPRPRPGPGDDYRPLE